MTTTAQLHTPTDALFRPDRATLVALLDKLRELGWIAAGAEIALYWTDAGEFMQRRHTPIERVGDFLPKDVPWALRVVAPGAPGRCEQITLLLTAWLTPTPGSAPATCACGATLAEPASRRRDGVTLEMPLQTLPLSCRACNAEVEAPAFRFALSLRGASLDADLAAAIRSVLGVDLR